MTDIVERLRGNAIGNQARIPWPHRLLHDAAEEIERLRAALEEIVDMEVYGFDIVSSNGSEVYCEGTNRFCRESDMITTRRIARAALAQGGE